jgi:signal transduction histidine kinase
VPDIEIITLSVPAGFRVIVRDRGIGVNPEDLPRVFDPYFTTKRTGSGLGLAIAKNIIDGMGGAIAIDPRRGGGTEIRIDVPHATSVASADVRRRPMNSGRTTAPHVKGGPA